ncbi:MAG: hypothetical protein AAGU21_22040 [Solidesulfovibrio sp.]|uniref:hypothetical protein n=1 Tax=Solidesulfovibrio sp. TaxID=2910990 RepID=UPI003157F5E7
MTKPTIESVHRDVGFANQYRLELIKHMMTLAAALLAFTISFRPSLKTAEHELLMFIGWIALGLSLMSGIFHMLGWDRYYISFRDYDFHDLDGEKPRKSISKWRRTAMILQFSGFIIGVGCISFFAAFNIQNMVISK